KLLRFLQFREYERLGSNELRKADVRIICATNRDLLRLAEENIFRQDLYYRISVISLDLPPLRQRRDDISLLVEHFIEFFNRTKNTRIDGISPAAMAALLQYDYPGNIRELRNIIEYAFALCRDGYIDTPHLPRQFGSFPKGEAKIMTLEELERIHIEHVLALNHGNRTKSAEQLGINTSTLWRKLKK
ncbi:MAG: sigma 54-interacting transcriptional regulator, partial [Spirochaetota bacterium]